MNLLIAFLIGAVTMWIVNQSLRYFQGAAAPRPSDAEIAAIRWERTKAELCYDALRHLRRHLPTHEMMTNVRFLDLVKPMGHAASSVIPFAEQWTVPIVLIDKRTGLVGNLVLNENDPDLEGKRNILMRTGIKVFILPDDAGEAAILELLAA